MEYSTWTIEQIEMIDHIIENLSKEEFSKYKLGWLKKLIKKVDKFQADCSTCKEYKTIIEKFTSLLTNIEENASSFNLKEYNSQISSIYKHLKNTHHIVPERHFTHLGTIIGVILGLTVTLLFMNMSPDVEKYGLWVGLAIGFFAGKYLDTRADSEDRVLK